MSHTLNPHIPLIGIPEAASVGPDPPERSDRYQPARSSAPASHRTVEHLLDTLSATESVFAERLRSLRDQLGARDSLEAVWVDDILFAVWRLIRSIQESIETPSSGVHAIAAAERSLRRAIAALRDHRDRPLSTADTGTQTDRSSDADSHALDEEASTSIHIDPEPESEPEGRWRSRLCLDPSVSETSPVIRGTWITVSQVVSRVIDGWTWEQILKYYPELTERDVRACLAYTVEQDDVLISC